MGAFLRLRGFHFLMDDSVATTTNRDNVKPVVWFISIIVVIMMGGIVASNTQETRDWWQSASFDSIVNGTLRLFAIRVLSKPAFYTGSDSVLVFASIPILVLVAVVVFMGVFSPVLLAVNFDIGLLTVSLVSSFLALSALVIVPVFARTVFIEFVKLFDLFTSVASFFGHKKPPVGVSQRACLGHTEGQQEA
jgi:hypothetical protein